MNVNCLYVLLLFVFSSLHQQPLAAQQLDTLAGGIVRYDDYRSAEGAYIFWPAASAKTQDLGTTVPDSLGLVVFTHGYGGLNPLNYGAWLRHIIEQGNVVIYPRYQRNLYIPRSTAFAKTVSVGLASALAWLGQSSNLPVQLRDPIYVGHSYGGVLTAYLLASQDSLGLPPAFGAVLAAPGTSRLKGSRLESYASIDTSTQIIIVSHAGDELVGDEFAKLVFETVDASTPILWLPQEREEHGEERLGQGHNECYALDEAFDTGYRNFTTKRALRIACEDDLDRQLYWPLVDEMLLARQESRMHTALKTRAGEFALGQWSDGTLRRPVVARYRENTNADAVPAELRAKRVLLVAPLTVE